LTSLKSIQPTGYQNNTLVSWYLYINKVILPKVNTRQQESSKSWLGIKKA